MHNILVIVTPVRVSQPPSRFPLGLGYVAAILEQLRFHVSVLGLNAMRPPPELERELIRVATRDIDMVATGGFATSFKTIARIARHVKYLYPHVPLVVGGTITASISDLLPDTRVNAYSAGRRFHIAFDKDLS